MKSRVIKNISLAITFIAIAGAVVFAQKFAYVNYGIYSYRKYRNTKQPKTR